MVIESAFFWMGAKKEVKLNYERDRHTKIIVKAIEYLKKSVELYVAGDLESKKYAMKVMKCEQCGDVIFRDLIMKIANSLIPANEKHDLMSLLTHMEHVAEYASRAARTLLIGHSVELPGELRQLLLELTLRVYDCIVSLDRLSEERRDFQRIMEISEEVIEKKNEIEDIKTKILSWVVTNQILSITQEFFLRELISYLEGIGDSAERSVDVHLIVAVKR